MNSLLIETFTKLRENSNLKREVIRDVNKYSMKISEQPYKFHKYIQNLQNILRESTELVQLLQNLYDKVTKNLFWHEPVEFNKQFYHHISLLEPIYKAQYIKLHSLYFSSMIPEQFYLAVKSKLPFTPQFYPEYQKNSLSFLLQLPEESIKNFSYLYNQTFEVPRVLQFYVSCSYILTVFAQENHYEEAATTDMFQHFLNIMLLYSCNMVNLDSVCNILNAIHSQVVDLFMQYSDIPKEQFHVSYINQFLKNFLPQKIEVCFHQTMINFFTDNSFENKTPNIVKLVSFSRFKSTQNSSFWTDFGFVDLNANYFYKSYKIIAKYSRIQNQQTFENYSKVVLDLVGPIFSEERMKEPSVITNIKQSVLTQMFNFHKESQICLVSRMNAIDSKSNEFRILYKRFLHRSYVKRLLLVADYTIELKDNLNLELGPFIKALNSLNVADKFVRFINDITMYNNIYINENTAKLFFYLSRLQSIAQAMTEKEKGIDIWEVITKESTPYTAFSKELTCVDMVLIKFARLLHQIYYGTGPQFHLSIFQDKRKKYLQDDFIFSLRKNGGTLVIKAMINPFIQP